MTSQLVISNQYQYRFFHPEVVDSSDVCEWVNDAYGDDLPDSTMPTSLEGICMFLDYMFWDLLCRRAMAFDDIDCGGSRFRAVIVEYLNESPDNTLDEFIEEWYDSGAFTVDSQGTQELLDQFHEEVFQFIKERDVCFVKLSTEFDDLEVHSFAALTAEPSNFRGATVFHQPIKNVW
jgi:hypothetical protein